MIISEEKIILFMDVYQQFLSKVFFVCFTVIVVKIVAINI